MVIGSKVYVAWKQTMLHDVTLHDVIDGHQAYIHIQFCSWLRQRAVHALCARRDYKPASRELFFLPLIFILAFLKGQMVSYVFIFFIFLEEKTEGSSGQMPDKFSVSYLDVLET